jgi:hypothetical protein
MGGSPIAWLELASRTWRNTHEVRWKDSGAAESAAPRGTCLEVSMLNRVAMEDDLFPRVPGQDGGFQLIVCLAD